ncbi:MAG: pilus assembly protein TadG-related protein [Brevundimonas sp.]|nr:pilus assembly protein TadG-related protein [Brevundimonas sp.]
MSETLTMEIPDFFRPPVQTRLMAHALARMRRFFDRAKLDEKGNVALIGALALPLIVGGAGLSVETTYWYYKNLQLQSASDSAVFAAGIEKRSGSDDAVVRAAALSSAEDNGFDPAAGGITVHLPPVSGKYTGQSDAVEVVLTASVDRFFSQVFDSRPITLTGRAVARFARTQDACVLALNRTASSAANFAGNANVTFNGCSVMANSTAVDAVSIQGAASLSADCLISVGGVQTNSAVTLTKCPAALTEAPPVADPFANVSPPQQPSGGCKSAPNNPKTSYSLSPGRYCSGLDIKGDGALEPGIYYLDGDLNVSSNATLRGSGVTIYLHGAAKVTINGTASLDLQAPTSGPYAGILIFADRANRSGNTSRFNGTAASRLTGAIYMPTQAIEYLGNFSGINGCTQVVGDTVKWSGSASVAVDCSALGLRTIPAYSIVQLVE